MFRYLQYSTHYIPSPFLTTFSSFGLEYYHLQCENYCPYLLQSLRFHPSLQLIHFQHLFLFYFQVLHIHYNGLGYILIVFCYFFALLFPITTVTGTRSSLL